MKTKLTKHSPTLLLSTPPNGILTPIRVNIRASAALRQKKCKNKEISVQKENAVKQDGVEQDVVIKENVEIEGDIEQDTRKSQIL